MKVNVSKELFKNKVLTSQILEIVIWDDLTDTWNSYTNTWDSWIPEASGGSVKVKIEQERSIKVKTSV